MTPLSCDHRCTEKISVKTSKPELGGGGVGQNLFLLQLRILRVVLQNVANNYSNAYQMDNIPLSNLTV